MNVCLWRFIIWYRGIHLVKDIPLLVRLFATAPVRLRPCQTEITLQHLNALLQFFNDAGLLLNRVVFSQRKIIDFSADCSFRSAAKKMQEHYGIEVPESTIRAITLGHANCMQKESIVSVEVCQICTGEDARFIGEMDGSMIPIVLVDE